MRAETHLNRHPRGSSSAAYSASLLAHRRIIFGAEADLRLSAAHSPEAEGHSQVGIRRRHDRTAERRWSLQNDASARATVDVHIDGYFASRGRVVGASDLAVGIPDVDPVQFNQRPLLVDSSNPPEVQSQRVTATCQLEFVGSHVDGLTHTIMEPRAPDAMSVHEDRQPFGKSAVNTAPDIDARLPVVEPEVETQATLVDSEKLCTFPVDHLWFRWRWREHVVLSRARRRGPQIDDESRVKQFAAVDMVGDLVPIRLGWRIDDPRRRRRPGVGWLILGHAVAAAAGRSQDQTSSR